MTQPTFNVRIITHDGAKYASQVVSLTAPGEDGYLGVLAHHAPLMTTLIPGKITIKEPDGLRRTFAMKGRGFLEVSKNLATLLLDDCSPA